MNYEIKSAQEAGINEIFKDRNNARKISFKNELGIVKEILDQDDLKNILAIIEEDTSGEYQLGEFANTIIPRAPYDKHIIGEAVDYYEGSLPGYLGAHFFDRLNDGTIILVYNCQSVFQDGTMIFESSPLDGLNGWWVAYRQDPNNENELLKVGEVQMTEQFWNQWYTWTAKDSSKNCVKFVNCSYPTTSSDTLESWITKVTWTGTELIAEDIYFNYNGATVMSLYNDLTGLEPTSAIWQYYEPEFILDDDYYGMAMGTEAGWFWYRNTMGDLDGDNWIFVGYNIITGDTKYVDCMTELANVTNFAPDWAYYQSIIDLVNHPNGLTLMLWDGLTPNNGDNYEGVTALWSPYWQDPTTCMYLDLRYQDVESPTTFGTYTATMGSILARPFYWDGTSFYLFVNATSSAMVGATTTNICHKYNTNTREITSYYIATPFEGGLGLYANNNGLLLIDQGGKVASGTSFVYLKHADDITYILNKDVLYPTNMFDNKIINTTSTATFNIDRLGVIISSYRNITF